LCYQPAVNLTLGNIWMWEISSDPLSSQTLAKDDVAKIHIGAHIDGFAAVTAETIVVGATAENPVTGRRADVLKAAYTAAEVAMRLVKVGGKNWAVTDAVNKVAGAWGCKPVEGWSYDGHSFRSPHLFLVSQVCCHVNKSKTLSMGRGGLF
jgi:methionine aminopeptidase